MSFNQIYRVAGSAMTAQTIRLNTIASNLANAESPAASAATVYKARSPVFSAVYSARTAADPRGVQSAQVQVLMWWRLAARYSAMSPITQWPTRKVMFFILR